MPTDNFILNDEEKAIIQARRDIKAREEAARLEQQRQENVVGDVLTMSASELMKLPPEQRASMLKDIHARVMRGD